MLDNHRKENGFVFGSIKVMSLELSLLGYSVLANGYTVIDVRCFEHSLGYYVLPLDLC